MGPVLSLMGPQTPSSGSLPAVSSSAVTMPRSAADSASRESSADRATAGFPIVRAASSAPNAACSLSVPLAVPTVSPSDASRWRCVSCASGQWNMQPACHGGAGASTICGRCRTGCLSLDDKQAVAELPHVVDLVAQLQQLAVQDLGRSPVVRRSEEHTSELQSLRHLVCRL